MIWNTIHAAYRSLEKSALYSALSVLGLAVAMAAALITVLYVGEELSYDQWIPDYQQIYRLETAYNSPGRQPRQLATTMMPVKTFLEADFAQIEMAVRIETSGISLTYGDKMFGEGIAFADPEIFDLFGFEVIEGSLENVFSGPTELVLTRRIKEKYFGTEPAVGKTLIVNGDDAHTVVAVIEDLPRNTHLDITVIAPISSPNYYWRDVVDTRWDRATLFTYLKVSAGTDIVALENEFDQFISRHVPTIRITGVDIAGEDLIDLSLRPVTDIHLGSNYLGEMLPGGNPDALIGLSTAVFLLLAIGSINYTNLATARYTLRTREVAMRKVLGASQKQLMFQFMGESILFAFGSLVIALALAEVALPFFNDFVQKDLAFTEITNLATVVMIALIPLGVGIVGGIYPALIVSRLRPNSALGGRDRAGGTAGLFQQGLVILQFAASVGLIISAIIVYSQDRFLFELDLGYDSSNLIVVRDLNRGPDINGSLHATFTNRLLENASVIAVASSSVVPSDQRLATMAISKLGNSDSANGIESKAVSVSAGFFDTYRIVPRTGRTFLEGFDGDMLRETELDSGAYTGAIILNTAAVRQLGMTEAGALGESIAMKASSGNNRYSMVIIGVVPDFHLQSAHDVIGPAVFYSSPAAYNDITIRIGEENRAEALAFIDDTWSSILSDQNIFRQSLVEAESLQYQDEHRQQVILTVAAGLATLVAGVGLFGLAAFAAERRTKEIGIRKVLGARTTDIIRLFLWQFSKPVLWSNLIGWPLAWLLMRDWLNNFAYRIDLAADYFVAAGMLVLAVAWLAVSTHAFRVAKANPVHALRYE